MLNMSWSFREMQKFKVEPKESSKGASVQIKAESMGEAYRIYLSDHCGNGIPECPIFVIVGGVFGYKQLFHDHLKESARREAEIAQKAKIEEKEKEVKVVRGVIENLDSELKEKKNNLDKTLKEMKDKYN